MCWQTFTEVSVFAILFIALINLFSFSTDDYYGISLIFVILVHLNVSGRKKRRLKCFNLIKIVYYSIAIYKLMFLEVSFSAVKGLV